MTDNVMCQDILINVIFGCEWRLRFLIENGSIDFCPCQPGPGQCQCTCETSVSNIILLPTIVTVSIIKFTLKCLLYSLLYFIGLLVIRNKQYIWNCLYLLNYYFILF